MRAIDIKATVISDQADPDLISLMQGVASGKVALLHGEFSGFRELPPDEGRRMLKGSPWCVQLRKRSHRFLASVLAFAIATPIAVGFMYALAWAIGKATGALG